MQQAAVSSSKERSSSDSDHFNPFSNVTPKTGLSMRGSFARIDNETRSRLHGEVGLIFARSVLGKSESKFPTSALISEDPLAFAQADVPDVPRFVQRAEGGQPICGSDGHRAGRQ